jgi:hypothetical protein
MDETKLTKQIGIPSHHLLRLHYFSTGEHSWFRLEACRRLYRWGDSRIVARPGYRHRRALTIKRENAPRSRSQFFGMQVITITGRDIASVSPADA